MRNSFTISICCCLLAISSMMSNTALAKLGSGSSARTSTQTPAAPQPNPSFAPNDFQATFPLTAEQEVSEGSIAKLELTAEIFAVLKKNDFSDLAVFNSAGQMVPSSFYTVTAAESMSVNTLKLFPIFEENIDNSIRSLHIYENNNESWQMTQNINIDSPGKPKLTGYIMVLPEAGLFLQSLQFEWDETLATRIKLEGSTDLQSWYSVTSSATLAKLVQGQDTLSVNTINISRTIPGTYLRLTFLDKPLNLHKVEATAATLDNAPPISHTHQATPMDMPEGTTTKQIQSSSPQVSLENVLFFDLGGLYPAEAINLQWSGFGLFQNIKILGRDNPDAPWRYVGTTSLYRIKQNEVIIQNPEYALEVQSSRSQAMRYLQVDFGPSTPPPGLLLSIRYQPQNIFFLAQGSGPYTLGAGYPQRIKQEQDILPLLKSLDPNSFIQVNPGIAAFQQAPSTSAEQKESPLAKYILWTLLGLIVAGMSYMAIQLLGKVRKEE